jgi:hypothetical protein
MSVVSTNMLVKLLRYVATLALLCAQGLAAAHSGLTDIPWPSIPSPAQVPRPTESPFIEPLLVYRVPPKRPNENETSPPSSLVFYAIDDTYICES